MPTKDQNKLDSTGGPTGPTAAEPFKDLLNVVSQMGHATAKLTEDFLLQAQKPWSAAAETSVKLWGQMTHAWVDAATGATQLQVDFGQKMLESIKGLSR